MDSTIQALNKKYPVGTVLRSVDGYDYRIRSEWSKEADVYGAWARNEKKNSSIWLLHSEVIDFDSTVVYES